MGYESLLFGLAGEAIAPLVAGAIHGTYLVIRCLKCPTTFFRRDGKGYRFKHPAIRKFVTHIDIPKEVK